MAHSYHHAVSSARRFGGLPADYQAVHDWLDGSKEIIADFRHRALKHHAKGCFAAEALFGTTICNSAGRTVPVRLIAEQHILEDSAVSRRSPTGCAASGRSLGWAGSGHGLTRASNRRRPMADHFTQFSCLLDVGSAENAALAGKLRSKLDAELDRDDGRYVGFEMEVDGGSGPGALWIHSDEYGEPEDVIKFLLRCAEIMNLQGCWGFTWSLSCSRPRIDAFGGGAHILDLGKRETVAWVDCTNLVIETTPADRPNDAAATESGP